MDTDTLAALQASISHWEANLRAIQQKDYPSFHMYCDHCPLCQIFSPYGHTDSDCTIDSDCTGCPVREHTGYPQCEGSPWENIPRDLSEVTEAQVQAELDYLRSLLPQAQAQN